MTETTAQTTAPTADRDALLTALQTAARDVIDQRGTPGAMRRTETLRATLDGLIKHDAHLAVVVTAALWLDRYGTAGAPERMVDLQDALDNLPAPTPAELDALANPAVAASLDGHSWAGPGSLEDTIESGEFTGRPQSVSDLFTDDDERTPAEIAADVNPDAAVCSPYGEPCGLHPGISYPH